MQAPLVQQPHTEQGKEGQAACVFAAHPGIMASLALARRKLSVRCRFQNASVQVQDPSITSCVVAFNSGKVETLDTMHDAFQKPVYQHSA